MIKEEKKFRSDLSLLNVSELKYLHSVLFGDTDLLAKEELISACWLGVMNGKFRHLKDYRSHLKVILSKFSDVTLKLIVDQVADIGSGKRQKKITKRNEMLKYLCDRFNY